jgi:hypothetical protein
MADAFILGLGSGSACLVTCGMVMFPYLMSESAGVWRIAADISVFLVTRLLVYLVLATVAWFFGQSLLTEPVFRTYMTGILYVGFASMLLWYSIKKNRKKECPAGQAARIHNRRLVPLFLGLVNSIGFCPALLIMLTKSSEGTSLAGSWVAFIAFFAGSSLWFFPVPFAGRIRKRQVIETVGTLATGLAGTIYIIRGITLIIGGIING